MSQPQSKCIWAVVPASGIGSRMQSQIPKQYLPFHNKTVIEVTLDRLLGFDAIEGVVVVLNEQDTYWDTLNYSHNKPVLVAQGDRERFGSVLNGLEMLDNSVQHDNRWVMIHDAVRPCIAHEDLSLLVKSEDDLHGVFLAHPVSDTLKKSDGNNRCIETVDREALWRAFTPQMFPLELIIKALKKVVDEGLNVTDDVSAVESLGLHPKIILGRSDNIKITYPHDILIAETIIQNI